MPKHLLHRSKLRSVFEKMGREAMAKGMGRDRCFDAGILGVFFDLREEIDAADRLAPQIEENLFLLPALVFAPEILDVGFKPFEGEWGNGDRPLLVPFAMPHDDEAIGEIDGGKGQRAKFGDAEAGGVHRFQHRLIPHSAFFGGVRGVQKAFDLFESQNDGKIFLLFGAFDPVRGFRDDPPFG